MASSVSSLSPKAVSTEKTLATGSEPHTGSPYYIDFVKQLSKNFQEESPSGVFSQM